MLGKKDDFMFKIASAVGLLALVLAISTQGVRAEGYERASGRDNLALKQARF